MVVHFNILIACLELSQEITQTQGGEESHSLHLTHYKISKARVEEDNDQFHVL